MTMFMASDDDSRAVYSFSDPRTYRLYHLCTNRYKTARELHNIIGVLLPTVSSKDVWFRQCCIASAWFRKSAQF